MGMRANTLDFFDASSSDQTQVLKLHSKHRYNWAFPTALWTYFQSYHNNYV